MKRELPPRPKNDYRRVPPKTPEEQRDFEALVKERRTAYEKNMKEAAQKKAQYDAEQEAKRASIRSKLALFLARLPEKEATQIVEDVWLGSPYTQSHLEIWGNRDEASALDYGFLLKQTTFDGCTNERCSHHSHDAGDWWYRMYSNEDPDKEAFFLVGHERHNRTLREPGSEDGVSRKYLHVDLNKSQIQIVSVTKMDGRHTRIEIEEK